MTSQSQVLPDAWQGLNLVVQYGPYSGAYQACPRVLAGRARKLRDMQEELVILAARWNRARGFPAPELISAQFTVSGTQGTLETEPAAKVQQCLTGDEHHCSHQAGRAALTPDLMFLADAVHQPVDHGATRAGTPLLEADSLQGQEVFRARSSEAHPAEAGVTAWLGDAGEPGATELGTPEHLLGTDTFGEVGDRQGCLDRSSSDSSDVITSCTFLSSPSSDTDCSSSAFSDCSPENPSALGLLPASLSPQHLACESSQGAAQNPGAKGAKSAGEPKLWDRLLLSLGDEGSLLFTEPCNSKTVLGHCGGISEQGLAQEASGTGNNQSGCVGNTGQGLERRAKMEGCPGGSMDAPDLPRPQSPINCSSALSTAGLPRSCCCSEGTTGVEELNQSLRWSCVQRRTLEPGDSQDRGAQDLAELELSREEMEAVGTFLEAVETVGGFLDSLLDSDSGSSQPPSPLDVADSAPLVDLFDLLLNEGITGDGEAETSKQPSPCSGSCETQPASRAKGMSSTAGREGEENVPGGDEHWGSGCSKGLGAQVAVKHCRLVCAQAVQNSASKECSHENGPITTWADQETLPGNLLSRLPSGAHPEASAERKAPSHVPHPLRRCMSLQLAAATCVEGALFSGRTGLLQELCPGIHRVLREPVTGVLFDPCGKPGTLRTSLGDHELCFLAKGESHVLLPAGDPYLDLFVDSVVGAVFEFFLSCYN